MAFIATPVNILDGAASSKPMRSYNDGTTNTLAHASVDSAGTLISPATADKQDTLAGLVATASKQDALAALVATAAKQDTLAGLVATAANQATLAALLGPVTGMIAMSTLDTVYTVGRYFAVKCTVAGNVAITYSDDTISVLPVVVGLNVFYSAVKKVNTSGTTATATYENWK